MKKAISSGLGPTLIELVAAVLVFALCSAICVKLFAGAKLISDAGADLSCAVVAAQSAAECFKSSDGDAAATSRLLGGSFKGENFSVYYDAGWCLTGEDGKFALYGEITEDHGLRLCEITITNEGKEIFRITAASHGEVTP